MSRMFGFTGAPRARNPAGPRQAPIGWTGLQRWPQRAVGPLPTSTARGR